MPDSFAITTAVPHILLVIPVYNHAATLRSVVKGALAIHPHVLVVDDGSTDMPASPICDDSGFVTDPAHPLHGLAAHLIRHRSNKGKGVAILTGAHEAKQRGMTHIITIDADGQHNTQELELFFLAIKAEPSTLFVGCRDFNTENVPFSSKFGRSFSNFWFTVQTEKKLADTQSGFRAYPLAILETITCTESRYSFEVEVLVRAAWAGFAVADIPISVYYPPRSERVSHFKPFADNIRISLLNTRLTIRAIMPVPQKKYAHNAVTGQISPLHPLRSLRLLLAHDATPSKLAFAGALGVFFGTLPFIGLRSLLIILVAGTLRLNKLTGLATSQLCLPPFIPALCIETGFYIRNGYFLTDISLQTLGFEVVDRVVDWILGSLFVAPVFALIMGSIVYILARCAQLGISRFPQPETPASPAACQMLPLATSSANSSVNSSGDSLITASDAPPVISPKRAFHE